MPCLSGMKPCRQMLQGSGNTNPSQQVREAGVCQAGWKI